MRTLNIASSMWIGGFDLESKSKSTKGRRTEDTEMQALKTGFIGIHNIEFLFREILNSNIEN